MIDTSPTRLLYEQTKEEDNSFGDWYRDNEISVENYWVFLQVFRLLKEGDNLGQLKSLIELVNPVEQQVSQPSEPSFGQWIPVESIIKPQKGEKVLVVQNPKTTATREPLFAIYDGEDFIPPTPMTFANFEYGKSKWSDIIKWMPLPKS